MAGSIQKITSLGEHRDIQFDRLDRLETMSLISEIVSWKLRLFVPTGADGANVLARLMARFPLERVVERSPARAA